MGKVKYTDYSEWENDMLNSDALKKQEEYWVGIFSDEIPILDMPIDYRRPAIQSFEGDTIDFKINKDLTRKIIELGEANGTTMYMNLLAVHNILLSKYCGQDDIIVGSPIAGRQHSDLQSVIGMFVNTLAMRNYPKGDKTFKEFLKDVKINCLGAYENQNYQFDRLVEKLDLRRDLSRNTLFDTMFVLQNTEIQEIEIDDLQFESFTFENKISKFDMTLTAIQKGEEILFTLEYCTKLYKQETIEKLIEHFINIISEVTKNPDLKLSEIDMLSAEEKKKILVDFNNTMIDYPKNKVIYELFEEQAEKTPENTAVVYMNKKLTYRELNEKSNSLATELIEKGVKPNSIVGIMVERSLEMIIGILGILKAGGAYLPIDPDAPQERVEFMLVDSNTQILLTQKHLADNLNFNVTTLVLEDEELYKGNNRNLEKVNKANDLTYIIYTSGSTGKPKGVMIEHDSVMNLLTELQKRYPLGVQDSIMLKTNYIFDVSVTELFGWFFEGGKLTILENGLQTNSKEILKTIEINDVTHINFVPSMLSIFLNSINENDVKILNKLKYLFVAGEQIHKNIIHQFYALNSNVKLENLYGPTEATVYATAYSLTNEKYEESVPIGKPIANTKIYIVNENNRVQPIGVAGELCISGKPLARGYLNRPELAKEKFIPNPFEPGETMYRTGDLARWTSDGNIECIGRIDYQVKLRGYRIELGEIENELLKIATIKEVVVIDREDKQGNKYLCAYIVSDKEITVTELRGALSKKLPDYMIPSYFIILEKLPLMPNGKLDRKSLPEPDGEINIGVEYAAPTNKIEETMAEIWSEVLGVQKIGIDDNFFALGGDSIKAIQVAARLNRHNIKIIIGDVFTNPTIRELSICAKLDNEQISQSVVEGKVELTAVQNWFFEQEFHDMHHWNQSVMLYSKDGFDEKIIREVFSEIVEHHDALRMVFKEENKLIQYNKGINDKLFDFYEVDFTHKESYEEEIEKECIKIQSSINLSQGPLVKLGLFRTTEGDHLLIVIHHLVIDGVSWRILFEDFAIGYRQAVNKEKIQLPEKTNSFMTWSEKINNYAKSNELLGEIDYWKSIEDAGVGEIFKDCHNISNKGLNFNSMELKIDKENTNNLLKNVNKAYSTEINYILLAALGLTIKEWSGENKILINLEGHGREEIISNMNITRTIGWFTSMFPIVLDCEKSEEISYYIKSVKESLRKIPNKGTGYGILKYLTPNEYLNELEFKLKPQVTFNYLGQFDMDMNEGWVNRSSISTGNPINKEAKRVSYIDINGGVSDGELSLVFEYNEDLFTIRTIQGFIEKYKEKLLDIIQHCVEKEDTENTPSDFDYKDISIEELESINLMLSDSFLDI